MLWSIVIAARQPRSEVLCSSESKSWLLETRTVHRPPAFQDSDASLLNLQLVRCHNFTVPMIKVSSIQPSRNFIFMSRSYGFWGWTANTRILWIVSSQLNLVYIAEIYVQSWFRVSCFFERNFPRVLYNSGPHASQSRVGSLDTLSSFLRSIYVEYPFSVFPSFAERVLSFGCFFSWWSMLHTTGLSSITAWTSDIMHN